MTFLELFGNLRNAFGSVPHAQKVHHNVPERPLRAILAWFWLRQKIVNDMVLDFLSWSMALHSGFHCMSAVVDLFLSTTLCGHYSIK